jgi:CRP/FNR family cyclic AMP-dependent transcriptional regulator
MSVVARAMPNGLLSGERERLLAMVDILESVPPEEVRALARRSAFVRLDARDAVLVSPDEHAERLLLLLAGRALISEECCPGRELAVSVVESGTIVGATGFAPHPCGLRVEAMETSTFCGVRRQALDELVERNPFLGMRVASLLGERLIQTEERLADLVRKEVPERLATQILRLVESEGVVTREGYKIPTRYTHQQLATMIGAKREAVTRAFGILRSEGGVELRDRWIFVSDLEALRRAAIGNDPRTSPLAAG